MADLGLGTRRRGRGVSRDPAQRITDVIEAVERCQRMSPLWKAMSLMEMAEDAIERNLRIIGQAVNHLPREITDAHPDNPCPQIQGFRNILVLRRAWYSNLSMVRRPTIVMIVRAGTPWNSGHDSVVRCGCSVTRRA